MFNTLLEQLLSTLEGHGSPGAIARYLERAGIKGTRTDPCNCPLAIWLTQYARKEVRVGSVTARIPFDNDSITRLPFAVAQFVEQFDSGSYDYLCA